MKYLLASSNKHKYQELIALLPSVTLELAEGLEDVNENAKTFLGNALIKAEAAYRQFHMPVIADDSGLCVSALGGAPGVFTARYGSDVLHRLLDSSERNAYLLKNMQGITDRSASFVCCIVAYISPYRIYTVSEEVKGSIAEKPIGAGGFGYDPVFVLDDIGKAMAQLTEEEKGQHSHRGKAARAMNTLLATLEEN
ncbi:MAG: RdgB/HAM1 family non-canonical purine NTP pyrophosphatase [Spirochaetia bacterium]|jgi:XTP/dITP diphosphohydrolase|nr:RdgB/HAM1 family non-canonical purine NTP pyrophosphatase [Spirochaetia bacterium]